MITIFILENDMEHRNKIETLLKARFKEICTLGACDYESAEQFLFTHKIDIFLLDIVSQNPNSKIRDGIDFGKRIRREVCYQTTPIIYTSLNLDPIQAAVNEVHCYQYLVKPFADDDLLSTIQSLFENKLLGSNCLVLSDTYGVYFKVEKKDILYIEATGKQMQVYYHPQSIHPSQTRKIITSKYRLQDFVQMLNDDFIRCHKRYLVNKKYICSYDRRMGLLQAGNIQIPVGRIYKDDVEAFFNA